MRNLNDKQINLIPTYRQSPIASKKPGYLSEKLKTLSSSNYHRV